jgi:hypothetical protein
MPVTKKARTAERSRREFAARPSAMLLAKKPAPSETSGGNGRSQDIGKQDCSV